MLTETSHLLLEVLEIFYALLLFIQANFTLVYQYDFIIEITQDIVRGYFTQNFYKEHHFRGIRLKYDLSLLKSYLLLMQL